MHLKELLAEGSNREQVVADCVELIEQEVQSKSGLSGMAIKAGYSVVNSVKPTKVRETVDHLLEEFADNLDPIYQEAKEKSVPVASYFSNNASRVADQLLTITDNKAKNAKSAAVGKTYQKLRGSAKKNVEQAVPRLGELVAKYDKSITS
jgi:vacuolar-type H+-ATPase subunit H